MKNRLFLVFLLFFSFSIFGDEKPKKIIAYYFHTTHRCATCLKIENSSKAAIEKYFKKEMEEGKISFVSINIEEENNRHYIQDYKLYTKSLILSIVQGEKEVKWKNLDKVWLKIRNEEEFNNYIKEEVESFLNEIK